MLIQALNVNLLNKQKNRRYLFPVIPGDDSLMN